VRLAAPLLQLPDFEKYAITEGAAGRLVDAALEAVSGLSEAEAGSSMALLFVWRTLARFGRVPAILRLIALSRPLAHGSDEEQNYFAEAVRECVASQGYEALEPVIQGLPFDDFTQGGVPDQKVVWPQEMWIREVTGRVFRQMA
jgi:hypothetical protein